MKTHLSLLIVSIILSAQAWAQITPHPQILAYYTNKTMLDYGSFNEWITSTETESLEQSVQNLEVLLLTTQSDYSDMYHCTYRYRHEKLFFDLKISAQAQKAIVRLTRKALEEVDTFPFYYSRNASLRQTKKEHVKNIFRCANHDLHVKSRTESEDIILTQRYGDQTIHSCLNTVSEINSLKAEAKARKVAALASLYRILSITGCSDITLLSKSEGPQYNEDVQAISRLVEKNFDFSNNDLAPVFQHWFKSLL